MKKYILCILFLFVALLAEAVETLLVGSTFTKNDGNWKTQPYWGGKAELVNENNRQLLQLTATQYKDGRVFAQIYNPASKRIICSNAAKYSFEITAKGKGTLVPGIILYNFQNTVIKTNWTQPLALSDELKTLKAEMTVPDCCAHVLPVLKIDGEGTARFAKVRFLLLGDNDTSIVPPQLQLIPEDAQAQPAVFKVAPIGQLFDVIIRKDGNASHQTMTADENGHIAVQLNQQASGVTQITVAAKGRERSAYVIVEPKQHYQTSDSLAKKLNLDKKLSILFIGDSLTDFYRGYNYIDRLQFWADKYNPDKIKIRNAGVGGDYITRVEERLLATVSQNANKAHRQDMYDRLFETPYDIIFIFLGHNDTKSSYIDKMTKPFISPDTQEQAFKRVFKFIQQRSKASIVLISPSPSDRRAFDARIAKLKPGQNVNVFGIDEFTDAFDAVNRNLCKQFNFKYMDILSVMRADPDRASLYVADGVHLSPKGGRVIADELLKFLAQ